MPWKPTAVEAVEGHKGWVIERIGDRAVCQEILYSLGDEFDVEKLDRGYNSDPETSRTCANFPRIIYHSTDPRGLSDIINEWSRRWRFSSKDRKLGVQLLYCDPSVDLQHAKLLAGTRAGQPIYTSRLTLSSR